MNARVFSGIQVRIASFKSETNLAAKMGLTRACVQRDGEIFLQKNSLMEIDPKGRTLTKEGRELLVNINKNYKV